MTTRSLRLADLAGLDADLARIRERAANHEQAAEFPARPARGNPSSVVAFSTDVATRDVELTPSLVDILAVPERDDFVAAIGGDEGLHAQVRALRSAGIPIEAIHEALDSLIGIEVDEERIQERLVRYTAPSSVRVRVGTHRWGKRS